LTRPPTVNALLGNKCSDPYPQPSLSLASIAAVLEDKMEVLPIFDGNFSEKYVEDLVSLVKSKHPDVVGFSVFTPFAKKVFECAKLVKKIDSKILVILGGPHGAVLPYETLNRCVDIDVIICGEGEITIQELMSGKPFKNVAGIAFRDNRKVIMTRQRSHIKDLDSLPYPAYHLLPNFPKGYKPHPPKSLGGVWSSIMWSRGCPFMCTYCCREASFGRTFRCNSPEYMTNLINYLHSQYGIDELTFYDDVFSLNRFKTIKLLEAMYPEKLGFRLNWDCETRVDLVDPELLRAMKLVGCRTIAYGIEHGLWIHRIKGGGATLKQAEKAVRWTHEADINTIGYFMVGLPNETPDTIRKTIDFAKRLDVTWAQFSILVPLPGCELYKQAVASGLIKTGENWNKYIYAGSNGVDIPVLLSDVLSKEELAYWRRHAYREFYLRRKYIMKRLFSVRSWRDLKLNIAGLKMLFSMIHGK